MRERKVLAGAVAWALGVGGLGDDLYGNRALTHLRALHVRGRANLFIFLAELGIARLRSGLVVNPEDNDVLRGHGVGEEEHKTVARRPHRAHRNAIEERGAVLADQLLYALSGASSRGAWAYFGTYAAARWLHSLFYLRGMQPWRTAVFAIGVAAMLGMLVHVVMVAL